MNVIHWCCLFLCMATAVVDIAALTNGKLVAPNTFPVIVSLRDAQNVHFCGGAIIGYRWIITSGRCAQKNPADIHAFVGAYTRTDGIRYPIESVHVHPQFQPLNLVNDIALLKTTKPIEYRNVRPVTLPSFDFNASGRPIVFIAGWGETQVNYRIEPRLSWCNITVWLCIFVTETQRPTGVTRQTAVRTNTSNAADCMSTPFELPAVVDVEADTFVHIQRENAERCLWWWCWQSNCITTRPVTWHCFVGHRMWTASASCPHPDYSVFGLHQGGDWTGAATTQLKILARQYLLRFDLININQ